MIQPLDGLNIWEKRVLHTVRGFLLTLHFTVEVLETVLGEVVCFLYFCRCLLVQNLLQGVDTTILHPAEISLLWNFFLVFTEVVSPKKALSTLKVAAIADERCVTMQLNVACEWCSSKLKNSHRVLLYAVAKVRSALNAERLTSINHLSLSLS